MTTQPLRKLRIGSITATIWNNPTDTGKARHSISIVRNYKKDDKWFETSSFSEEDLPVVSKLADMALNISMIIADTPDS